MEQEITVVVGVIAIKECARVAVKKGEAEKDVQTLPSHGKAGGYSTYHFHPVPGATHGLHCGGGKPALPLF